ncbi:MAG: ROK family protein, partial [Alphaproteobacteria bacterium]
TFGNPARFDDFLYLYIGLFIGGGVVMNGNLVTGPSGNAGAVGSMPVVRIDAQGNHFSEQLISSASIYSLEKQMIDKGIDASVIWHNPDNWSGLGPTLDHWINDTADSLAYAIASAISIIDFPAIIIDGAFPSDIRAAITKATAEKFTHLDRQGLSPLKIVEGTLGSTARALGGAAIPLLANFTRDREILFNEMV